MGNPATDTGTQAGVDTVPYFVAQPTALTLRVSAGTAHLGQVVLTNAAGRTLLQRRPGADPATVTLPRGLYTLELHHAQAGDPNAAPQLLFVRPVKAEAEQANQGAPPGTAGVILEAGQTCVVVQFQQFRPGQ